MESRGASDPGGETVLHYTVMLFDQRFFESDLKSGKHPDENNPLLKKNYQFQGLSHWRQKGVNLL